MEKKWRYTGTREDKYMWALKKHAEKKGQTRPDGWPSFAYLDRWLEYADRQLDAGFENCYIADEGYTLNDLHSVVDDFLYRCDLDFGCDVLGRPSERKRMSWFK